jgi:hypothetical protein
VYVRIVQCARYHVVVGVESDPNLIALGELVRVHAVANLDPIRRGRTDSFTRVQVRGHILPAVLHAVPDSRTIDVDLVERPEGDQLIVKYAMAHLKNLSRSSQKNLKKATRAVAINIIPPTNPR